MWEASMGEKKCALRAACLSQRSTLSTAECLSRSRLIQSRVLQFALYLVSRSVALYSPIQNEVGTDEIRDHAFKEGKKVFFPRVGQTNTLKLIQVGSRAELKVGPLGILEPTGEKQLSDRDVDGLVVFVPGVVFDSKGNRLGRGRGWYDRVLRRLDGKATTVALAYEFQVVDDVPAEEWDQKVHYVVTESKVIDCRQPLTQASQIS